MRVNKVNPKTGKKTFPWKSTEFHFALFGQYEKQRVKKNIKIKIKTLGKRAAIELHPGSAI